MAEKKINGSGNMKGQAEAWHLLIERLLYYGACEIKRMGFLREIWWVFR